MQLSSAASEALELNILKGNLFLDTESVPWTPWFIDGIEYKLLYAKGDMATALVKVNKGAQLARHRHLFPVELFLLEGTFGYEDEDGNENWIGPMGYLYEPPGTVHQPLCPDGNLGIAVFHGPISGLDADGNEIMLTVRDFYDRAKANNAVNHFTM